MMKLPTAACYLRGINYDGSASTSLGCCLGLLLTCLDGVLSLLAPVRNCLGAVVCGIALRILDDNLILVHDARWDCLGALLQADVGRCIAAAHLVNLAGAACVLRI